jgi:hypothetical protein
VYLFSFQTEIRENLLVDGNDVITGMSTGKAKPGGTLGQGKTETFFNDLAASNGGPF